MNKVVMERICKLTVWTVMIWSSIGLSTSYAQYSVQRGEGEELKGVVYKKEWAFEMTMHHNGFSIGYNTAKIRSFRKTHFYHVGIGYIGDPRQERQNRNFSKYGLSRGFYFGKQNAFYQLRIAKGTKRYLSEKYSKKGIALAYSYRIGPTLGVLKPVDLLIYNEEERGLESIRYSEDTKDKFLNYNKIYGADSWSKGWSGVRVLPGISGNLSLHFAMGAYSKYVRAMELGVLGDIYIKKIPIMVETELITNKPYFLKLYVNLQMGMRSN